MAFRLFVRANIRSKYNTKNNIKTILKHNLIFFSRLFNAVSCLWNSEIHLKNRRQLDIMCVCHCISMHECWFNSSRFIEMTMPGGREFCINLDEYFAICNNRNCNLSGTKKRQIIISMKKKHTQSNPSQIQNKNRFSYSLKCTLYVTFPQWFR